MADRDYPERAYAVGYKKPPKRGQFVKGKSGNPKGRGKGVRNFATDLIEEFNARVPVTEYGQRKKMTRQKAAAKILANKAATGDLKALPIVISELRRHEAGSAADPGLAVLCQPEDQMVIANIVRRIRAADIPTPDTVSEAENASADTPTSETGGTP